MPGRRCLAARAASLPVYPAFSYSLIIFAVHFVLISGVTARSLVVDWKAMLTPMLRPAIVTAVAAAMSLPWVLGVENWRATDMLLPLGVYGAALAIGFWMLCLTRPERALIIRTALRR